MSLLAHFYEYLTQVIDFFQLTGFAFTIPQVNWPPIGGLVDFVRFLQAALSGVGWSAWFWIATALVIVYFVVMIALPLTGVDCGDLLEEFSYWIGHFFFTGVLFIPITRVLIENYVCTGTGKAVLVRDPSVVCWEGVHIAYVLFGTIALILLLIGFGLKAKSMDDTIHDPVKRMQAKDHIRYLDTKYTLYRLLLVILSVTIRDDGLTGTTVFFVLSFLPFFYVFIKLPHAKNIANWIQGAKFFGNWWVFVCALLVATGPEAVETGSYMLIGTPVFLVVGVIFVVLRQKLCPPKGMNWNDVQWQDISDTNNQVTMTKYDKEASRREFEILGDDAFAVFLKQWEKDQSCQTPTKQLVIQGPHSDYPAEKQLISVSALKYLVTMIETNKTLTYLSIRAQKKIGEDHEIAVAIGSSLALHPCLQHVQIWSCGLKDEEGVAIAEHVLKSSGIQRLDLGDNAINAPASQKIKEMIKDTEGRELVFECF